LEPKKTEDPLFREKEELTSWIDNLIQGGI
jgi:hypothetical protein